MIISLSILNIEKENRSTKIKEFMNVKNNWIHFDVMDGKFVENKTFAYEVGLPTEEGIILPCGASGIFVSESAPTPEILKGDD